MAFFGELINGRPLRSSMAQYSEQCNEAIHGVAFSDAGTDLSSDALSSKVFSTPDASGHNSVSRSNNTNVSRSNTTNTTGAYSTARISHGHYPSGGGGGRGQNNNIFKRMFGPFDASEGRAAIVAAVTQGHGEGWRGLVNVQRVTNTTVR